MHPLYRLASPAPLASLVLAAAALLPAAARAYDYPTLDRVQFVQECMAEHPGPQFEMTSKCVCVVDALAAQVPLDDYVNMVTAAKATSIGGERGGVMRDSAAVQADARRWRELSKKLKNGCFIRTDTK